MLSDKSKVSKIPKTHKEFPCPQCTVPGDENGVEILEVSNVFHTKSLEEEEIRKMTMSAIETTEDKIIGELVRIRRVPITGLRTLITKEKDFMFLDDVILVKSRIEVLKDSYFERKLVDETGLI